MTQLFLNIVFSLQPELNLNVTIQQISFKQTLKLNILSANMHVSHLPDVLQRLSVHHTVEFGGRGFGPGAARSRDGLGRVLSLLLVFEHLGVLDDGGGELSLGAGYGQTLAVDVLVDAVLYVRKRERKFNLGSLCS